MHPRADTTIRRYNLHLLPYEVALETATEVPALAPCNLPAPCALAPFTAAAKVNKPADTGVHFYLDDYRFEWAWSDPLRYVEMLRRFYCVFTPDFSVYVDMPEPLQRYNVYRSRVVGRVWQEHGLSVVPTLTFALPESYDFCFDGLPQGGVVSLSTVGLMQGAEERELFRDGANEAMMRLSPSLVLAYGEPLDFDSGGAEVVWYKSNMAERFKALREGVE